ncbi:hypothetical protein ABZ897_00405 [Nonomuraea sp. NPDC046802]|uniref:hypothetical protein n=1 Tax=Nonomuraea sp. NPDC046802 TaxID=3154919 RepID=UPI0033CA5C94
MTDLWMSLSAAAVRLRLPVHEVLRMAIEGELLSRLTYDHWEVHTGAVAALRERLRTPLIPRDPANPAEAEMTVNDDAEYRGEQGT